MLTNHDTLMEIRRNVGCDLENKMKKKLIFRKIDDKDIYFTVTQWIYCNELIHRYGAKFIN